MIYLTNKKLLFMFTKYLIFVTLFIGIAHKKELKKCGINLLPLPNDAIIADIILKVKKENWIFL